METFTKILSMLTIVVAIMVALDINFNITKPGKPHWLKLVGGFSFLCTCLGWSVWVLMKIWGFL